MDGDHAEWAILTSTTGTREISRAWKIGPDAWVRRRTGIEIGRPTLRISHQDIIKATEFGEYPGISLNRPKITRAGVDQVTTWLRAAGVKPQEKQVQPLVIIKKGATASKPAGSLVDLNEMSITDIEAFLRRKKRDKAVVDCREAIAKCAAEHGFAVGDYDLRDAEEAA